MMSTFRSSDDILRDLRWLEAQLQDDRKTLDEVVAKPAVDSTTEVAKKEIKEWIYDGEDVVDELSFEELRAEVELPRLGRRPDRDLLADPHFQDRISKLKKRRKQIGDSLGLRASRGARSVGRDSETPLSSSLHWGPCVDGRVHKKEFFVKQLTEKPNPKEKLTVVPILGAAPVGKTTFVRDVYNDKQICRHFKKGWVCASRGGWMMDVMREIVESLTGLPCNYSQLGLVQGRLKKEIDDQRILLVLDDVIYKTIEGRQWDDLYNTFSGCENGSIILLTTRDRRVAERTGIPLEWESLPHNRLNEMSKQIARLPPHLKRCFAYCSVFPEGYLHNKLDLVRQWMAQGFIEEKVGRLMEDTGIEYFDHLLDMSLFRSSEVDANAHEIPNPCHALARLISDGESTEHCKLANLPRPEKVRHLSLTPANGELSANFASIATHLRSFLVIPSWPLKDTTHVSSPDIIFKNSNHLRVLDVKLTDISTLPDTIRNLKHLRYLNLNSTKIEHLDSSIFQLYHLQTLDLSCTDIKELPDELGNLRKLRHLLLNVTKITKLPKSIGNLSELQTLHLLSTELQELPVEIRGLIQLKVLHLNVSKVQSLPESVCGMSNLQTLEFQGASGEESGNGVIADDRDPRGQFSRESIQTIQNLGVDDMADSSNKEENLNGNLQSEAQVQRQDCRADRLIKWIGNPSLSRLAHVVLKGCVNCRSLPQLGRLPFLKRLEIDGMPVESIGQDFCGHGGNRGFPSLEELFFRNLNRWKIWDGVKDGELPRLESLVTFNCPNLLKMPNLCSSSLAKVEVERCGVEALHVPKSVEELHLCACDKISKLPALDSLSNLTIMYCRSLESLPVPKNLESLWIEECEQLSSWKLSLPAELEVIMLSSTTFVAKPRNPSPT